MQSKKIKMLAIEKDKSLSELAKALGTSINSFSQMLKRDNFREKELERIAAALGCELRIEFVDRD